MLGNAIAASITLLFLPGTFSLSCFVCNNDSKMGDEQNCKNVVEECADGTNSCSMLTYTKRDGFTRTRKFCTAKGAPTHHYMTSYPGSTFCHSINTTSIPSDKWRTSENVHPKIMPPAPPAEMVTALLCVCGTNLCNEVDHSEMIRQLDIHSNEPKKRNEKKLKNVYKFEKYTFTK